MKVFDATIAAVKAFKKTDSGEILRVHVPAKATDKERRELNRQRRDPDFLIGKLRDCWIQDRAGGRLGFCLSISARAASSEACGPCRMPAMVSKAWPSGQIVN